METFEETKHDRIQNYFKSFSNWNFNHRRSRIRDFSGYGDDVLITIKKMLKILIASPIYEGMEYCLYKFIDKLKEINYPNFDIVFFDNSRTREFYNKIKDTPGIKVIYDDTSENKNMFRVISSRNKILDYAINENYDYLLMMDCDVMVPKDILKKLLSHKKEVISGIYFNGFLRDGKREILPVCWKKITGKEIPLYRKAYPKITNLNWISRQLTLEEIDTGELFEVSVPSNGCCLLSRNAFTSGARYGILPIHRNKIETKSVTDEIKFFKQLRDNFNFKIYCDSSVKCGHDVEGKYLSTGTNPFHED